MTFSPALAESEAPQRFPWSKTPDESRAREVLISALRTDALRIEEVTLSSGAKAEYFVDAKRVTLQQPGFAALATLLSGAIRHFRATAVGGLTIGADPVVCSAVSACRDVKGFLIRKQRKEHGLQRWIEGPELFPKDRCLIVDEVVTQGGSVTTAIERMQDHGLTVVGVVAVLDRQAGGAKIVEAAARAPFLALTSIDEVYPERPDRREDPGRRD
ncbi:MAG: phosphoribosyltransferase [Actinomycetota bacterium]|nr:phosphoribosyltransferase [Actinomycetota bacterium]